MSELLPNWEAFLEHLKILLGNVGMPANALALKLKIKPSAVSQWFSGRTRPRGRVEEILEVLCQKGAFQDPLAVLDWTQLGGWEPDEQWLNNRFREWFKEHNKLPRGPILDDQGYLLSHMKHLVGRDNELNRAKKWLMSVERYRQPATKVVVIGGMPGVGKTALAQAIGRDPVIERYFRDGLLWAELGPDPDIDRWLREWAGLLGMPKDATSGPEAWLWKYLASEERRVLIILDDVWPGTHFERLMIGGPQCRVLITSHVITIADLYEKVHRLPVTTLEHSQALALALGLMERQVTEEEREGLEELVEIVGELPLAVEVSVATMKSQGVTPVLNQLRLRSRDPLAAVPGWVKQLEVPGAKPRQSSVPVSFRVAYDFLEEADQRRFRALGRLVRSTSFGEAVLAALWDDSVQEAKSAARRLVERSLLERVGHSRYRIHKLLHDFAAEMLEIAGEHKADEAWVEHFKGGIVQRWRWYWPCVPRLPGTPGLSGRAWLARFLRELKETAFRRTYLDLIKSRWEGKGIPAEAWVVGLWLHRRTRRNLRIGWGIVALSGFALIISWLVFNVLEQGGGIRGVPEWMLYGRLDYVITMVSIICALLIGWALWSNGVNLTNLRRLYYLPLDRYEALLGEESTHPNNGA